MGLAKTVLNTSAVRKEALRYLKKLAQSTNANASLGVLHCGEVVYLHRVPSPRIPDVYFHAGRRVPAHCTALGKILLANAPEALVGEVIEQRGLRPLTVNSITDEEAFRNELAEIRVRGFATDDEEYLMGTRCVAAAVYDAEGAAAAAVSISDTHTFLQEESTRAHVREVMETASKISHELGYSLYEPAPPGTTHRRCKRKTSVGCR